MGAMMNFPSTFKYGRFLLIAMALGALTSLLFLTSTSSQALAQSAYSWSPGQNGSVPRQALAGGQEPGRTLFICRARYNQGIHPGKVVGRNCNIGWGGREITINRYDVFVARDRSRLRWVNAANGSIPGGAIRGGQEPGRALYICRAAYQRGWHPGKIVGRNCNIGWGGREVTLSQYQVLIQKRRVVQQKPYKPPQNIRPVQRPRQSVLRWVNASNGGIPRYAYRGGYEQGRNLYVCRANYRNGWHPGKVVGRNCNIGWGGREITLGNYQVLTTTTPNAYTWIKGANGSYPRNAIIGGREQGRVLRICRAAYQGGWHPGKIVGRHCNFGWGGRERLAPSYQVMVKRQQVTQRQQPTRQVQNKPIKRTPPRASVRWLSAQNGAIPNNAIQGGYENDRRLYICRAKYKNGWHPGKVVGRNCNIGWGGREITISRYQVMTSGQSHAFNWVRAANGTLPRKAVIGGQEPGRTLYICRAGYKGGAHPGKIVGRNCNFGWGGREIRASQYQVLVRR